jgi:hypothetical protein
MENLNDRRSVSRWLKCGGIFFVVCSLAGLGLGIIPWRAASGILAAGLFQLLFAPEPIEDERVKQLKARAIMCGYMAGLSLLALYEVVARARASVSVLPSLTAFDGFTMATAMALALFKYWRWQDGRAKAVN